MSALDPIRMSTLAKLVVGLGALLFGSYSVIAAQQTDAQLVELPTAVDAWVPFSPPWILVYAGLYPILFAPMVVIVDRRVALRASLGMVAIVLMAVPEWLLWPVTVPRVPVPVTDVWTHALALIRSMDPPTNCFPSMHVATSTFAALCVLRHDRAAGAWTLGLAMGVWYASLAVGQHWFVDGLAGALMALGVDVWVYRGLPETAFARTPRWRHGIWLGLYAALWLGVAGAYWVG